MAGLLLLAAGPAYGQETTRVEYVSSDQVFPNPERGFYDYTATHSGGGSYQLLDAAALKRDREERNISLVFRYFVLKDFVDRPISRDYLDAVQQDFDAIRQAGLKAIIRFTYTNQTDPSFEPPHNDAPKERILQHLDQLAPVLQANQDVISVMQAGFIGIWGEWYYTDYFADPDDPSQISAQQQADRREVLSKILEVLPRGRMVQIRYIPQKQVLYSTGTGDKSALSPREAFSKTDVARVGYHNDCFLASRTDYGTYGWNSVSEDKDYLEQDSQYLPMGGETCNPDASRSQSVDTALEELRRFHWSYINSEYHPDILERWRNAGIMGTVKRRLGYRFELLEGAATRSVAQGDSLRLHLSVANIGWAVPFNRHDVELVLQAKDGTAIQHTASLASDPRFWQPGDTTEISTTVEMPEDLPVGSYDLALRLPDPALRDRPAYAIRLANSEVWDAQSGANDLLMDVEVRQATEEGALPVELVAFNAVADDAAALLSWRTASEIGNAGFEIQHRLAHDISVHGGSTWQTIGQVEGAGTTSEPQHYRYRAEGLAPGRHVFRLKQVDTDGGFTYGSETDLRIRMKGAYQLSVYPTPFQRELRLELSVRQPQEVSVDVFDVRGRRVARLHEGTLAAVDPHRVDWKPRGLASGTYLVRVMGEQFSASRSVVLVR